MSNELYYHVSSSMLGDGSVIRPGNWGRILMLYSQLDPILFREHVFELIRLQSFPEKPSRLQSAFAIETLDEAKRYKSANMPVGIIYEVQVEGRDVNIHRGNYDFSLNTDLSYTNGMHDLAKRYWSSHRDGCVELVIPAPLKIIRQVY